MPERFKFFSPSKKPRKREARPSFYKRYGPHWEAIRMRILIRDNWQCRHCGRVCGNKREAQVDHIVGKRLDGGDEESNLQVLCSKCHAKKSRLERMSG
jgi:5-methylcytosine-specific restriction protein A